MKKFANLPKSIKKTIRYIHQDASSEQALEIKKLLDEAINRKLTEVPNSKFKGGSTYDI